MLMLILLHICLVASENKTPVLWLKQLISILPDTVAEVAKSLQKSVDAVFLVLKYRTLSCGNHPCCCCVAHVVDQHVYLV